MKTAGVSATPLTSFNPTSHARFQKAAAALSLTVSLLVPAAVCAEGVAFPSALYQPTSHPITVFATGDTGGLFTNYWNGSKWVWQAQGTPPGVVLEGINSQVYQPTSHPLTDFINDDKGNLWTNYWNGTKWVWQNQGNPGVSIYGSDAVYQPTSHPLTDFVAGSTNGHLYDNYWNGSKWIWEDQGTPPGTTVEWAPGGAVYQPASHTLIVFANGANGHLYDKYWNGSKWVWEDDGRPPGTIAVDPPSSAIASVPPYSLQAYVTGGNGHLFERHGSGWTDLGTPGGFSVRSAPSAIYQPTSHPVTVFVVASNGHLFDTYFNGTKWQWEDQGIPPGDVSASASLGLSAIYQPGSSTRNLAVFTTGTTTGNLYVKYWDGSKGWQWENQGQP